MNLKQVAFDYDKLAKISVVSIHSVAIDSENNYRQKPWKTKLTNINETKDKVWHLVLELDLSLPIRQRATKNRQQNQNTF